MSDKYPVQVTYNLNELKRKKNINFTENDHVEKVSIDVKRNEVTIEFLTEVSDEAEDMLRFVVYKKCDKGWKIDKIFEDEDDAIDYVDEHKNEYGICAGIHYVHEELTEEEVSDDR